MYEIESLQGKKWIDCPSCFGCQHSCHVDGNAKLYRYSCVRRYSTCICSLLNLLVVYDNCIINYKLVYELICYVFRGERKCYYDNLFVEEKDAVDAHLKNVYTSAAAKVLYI